MDHPHLGADKIDRELGLRHNVHNCYVPPEIADPRVPPTAVLSGDLRTLRCPILPAVAQNLSHDGCCDSPWFHCTNISSAAPPPRFGSPPFLPSNRQFAPRVPQPALRVGIVMVGSRGDVDPYLHFAAALRKDGHVPVLITHAEFIDTCEGAGYEFAGIGGNPLSLMTFITKHPHLYTCLGKPHDFITLRKELTDMMVSVLDVVEHLELDVCFANPLAFVHALVKEMTGIPVIESIPQPWYPTKDWAHPMLPPLDATKVNTLTVMKVAGHALFHIFKGPVNAWRARRGLPKLHDAYFLSQKMVMPGVWPISSTVTLRPTDWGDHVAVVGYFTDSDQAVQRQIREYKPPADLVQFLQYSRDSGKPLVYIGFGSVPIPDPEAACEKIVQAVLAANVQAIVSKGWASLKGRQPDCIYYIGSCPHTWLFTKVDAVVFHGGCGTTATALRAGKPVYIVPFFMDQFYWASTMKKRNICGDWKLLGDHTPETLAANIKKILEPEPARIAADLGKSLQSEDGPNEGVDAMWKFIPFDPSDGGIVVKVCEIWKKSGSSWKYHGQRDPSGYLGLNMENCERYLNSGWAWSTPWMAAHDPDTPRLWNKYIDRVFEFRRVEQNVYLARSNLNEIVEDAFRPCTSTRQNARERANCFFALPRIMPPSHPNASFEYALSQFGPWSATQMRGATVRRRSWIRKRVQVAPPRDGRPGPDWKPHGKGLEPVTTHADDKKDAGARG